MTQRTLYLLRHADARETSASHRDKDRELSPFGREQVARVAQALAALGPAPQRLLVSTAMRTRQTAEGLRLGRDLDYSDALYHAGSFGVCEEISLVDPAVTSLLVVGHAPGIPATAMLLADPATSDPAALETIGTRYPTATLCRLELDVAWPDLPDAPRGVARLTHAIVTQ